MTVYQTGKSPDGKILYGGVWTLWHQEGYPIEMSHLQIASMDGRVDWCEAMLDASRSNNLPALMTILESFMPRDDIDAIKTRFQAMKPSGIDLDKLWSTKRLHFSAA